MIIGFCGAITAVVVVVTVTVVGETEGATIPAESLAAIVEDSARVGLAPALAAITGAASRAGAWAITGLSA
jgi:hypothetical protein